MASNYLLVLPIYSGAQIWSTHPSLRTQDEVPFNYFSLSAENLDFLCISWWTPLSFKLVWHSIKVTIYLQISNFLQIWIFESKYFWLNIGGEMEVLCYRWCVWWLSRKFPIWMWSVGGYLFVLTTKGFFI